MLEKLLNPRSFGAIMGHLTRCQIILPTSLGGLGLPLVVQLVAVAFLGCWALITPRLIFCFQQNVHLIFLDVMAHLETGTYLFQVALWDTREMLLKVIRSHVLPFKNLLVQSYLQM
jgi:hypothetical protein